MPPKKNVPPVEAPLPVVEKKDELPELLLKRYLVERHQQQSDLFEFTHGKYSDWMKYFGFNLETELRWQQDPTAHGTQLLNGGTKTGASTLTGTLRKGTQGTVAETSKHAQITSPEKTAAPQGTTSILKSATKKADEVSALPHVVPNNATHGAKKDAIDPLQTCALASDAGLETEERKAGYPQLDEFALQLGPCPGATLEEVARQLGAPYMRATWRQSTSQCAHHKTRVVFRWLCENFKLIPPNAPATAPAGSVTLPTAAPGEGKGAATTGAAGGKAAKGGKPPPAGAPVKGGAPVETALVGDKKAEHAFAARSCDAETLAEIYALMLHHIGVECKAVKGTLKGLLDNLGKPVFALPWGWNEVAIPTELTDEELELDDSPLLASGGTFQSAAVKLNGTVSGTAMDGHFNFREFNYGTSQKVSKRTERFLVDVSLALAYVGPRAAVSQPAGAPPPAASTEKKGGQTPRGQKEKDAVAAAHLAQQEASTGAQTVTTFGFSQLQDYSPYFEPFYFYTDPREFAALHFPEESEHQLLAKPLGKTHWEIYPRCSHEFYLNRIQLDSHRRRSWMTLKRTPFYISFVLGDTKHTELAINIFKGAAHTIDETAEPIDTKFFYSTREEVTGRQTFSIMLPDVGLYTVAVGYRHIDDRVDWANPPPYRFLTQYQSVVNFVPANETMFPKVHLGPALCKWVGPVGHKLVAGSNSLAVIPTNPRVHAVSVVNKVYKIQAKPPKEKDTASPTAPLAEATSAGGKPAPVTPREGAKKPGKGASQQQQQAAAAPPPPKPALDEEPEIDRAEIHLLPLNPSKGIFEGMVQLELGLVEFWVLLDPVGSQEAVHQSGFVSSLAEPSVLFSSYLGGLYNPPPLLPPGVAANSQDQAAGRDSPPMSTPTRVQGANLGGTAATLDIAALTQTTRNAPGAATPSPEVEGANASHTGEPSALPTLSHDVGAFTPFITEIHCVRRIPAKELNVNEGEPLVFPEVLDVGAEKGSIFKLLNGTSADGRNWDEGERTKTFLKKPLHKVGEYFVDTSTTKKV